MHDNPDAVCLLLWALASLQYFHAAPGVDANPHRPAAPQISRQFKSCIVCADCSAVQSDVSARKLVLRLADCAERGPTPSMKPAAATLLTLVDGCCALVRFRNPALQCGFGCRQDAGYSQTHGVQCPAQESFVAPKVIAGSTINPSRYVVRLLFWPSESLHGPGAS